MDKKKLTALVRLKTGWEKQVADRAAEAVLHSIRELVCRGNRLTIHGFGSFRAALAKPRRARNINTGESLLVPPKRRIKFKASPDFWIQKN